ncbi:MAG: type I-A CRISPR-associated protein Cas5a [Methanosarcinales archaeon]
MGWLKAEYEFGSLFSYRLPDFSSQYAISSPLPGPSTIKLAIVAAAIEHKGNVSYGEEIFNIIKNAEIKISKPKRVALFNVLIKRLKKKKNERGFEQTFGIRGYVHFPDSIKIYLKVRDDKREEIKHLMKRIRRFGTSDSLVYCKNVEDEDPPMDAIAPVETLENVSGKNVLIVPVKDLNPDPKIKFENVDIYNKTSKKDVFINKIYPIPISMQKQGKNWIIYEI